MGGAQPLAATMAGASCLAIECQRSRIEKRLATRYLDKAVESIDEALKLIDESVRTKTPVSVGLLGNAAEILPELVRRGVKPDAVTDQTSAHDLFNGYLPAGWTVAKWEDMRARDPAAVAAAARASIVTHVKAMLDFWRQGIPTLDYGNNIRQVAQGRRRRERVRFSRLRAGLYPPAVLPRHRAVPLGGAVGRSRGHLQDRRRSEGAVPGRTRICIAGSTWPRERIAFQGLPARICWLGLGERHRAGLAFNEMVASGRAQGAHRHRPRPSGLRLGRQPQPRDRRRCATARTPCPTGRCSTRCSTPRAARPGCRFHHGGGVGMGYSQHAGVVIVADGTRRRGEAHRARAVERSGHRRDAPRRRRLRDRDSMRARAGPEPADARWIWSAAR